MKRNYLLVVSFVFFVLNLNFGFAFGNGLSASVPQSDGIQWATDDVVAIAFLGYYDSYGMLKESPEYSTLCKQYPALAGVKGFDVETGGQQTYLIIPRDRAATVAVNEYTFDMFMSNDESSARVLYRNEDGRPILVSCNKADDLPDIHVYVTAGASHSDFQPRIDLTTGELVLMGGSVKDITHKGVFPMEEKILEIADYDGNKLGINVMLKNGRVAIYYDTPTINKWIWKGVCSQEGWVNLKGINGIVKDIYVGDIGQDTNPIVGLLMRDGTVKMFDVVESLHEDAENLYVSAPQKDMKNIVGFTNNADDDEERDYVTFFAVDDKGRQFEMSTYYLCGSIDAYLDGGNAREVVISMNGSGNIQLQVYDLQGKVEQRQGTFSVENLSIDTESSEYRVNYHCTRLLEGDKYVYVVLDGSFVLDYYYDGSKVKVTPRKGSPLGVGLGKTFCSKLVR